MSDLRARFPFPGRSFFSRRSFTTMCGLVIVGLLASIQLLPASQATYDVVYVRAPLSDRFADTFMPVYFTPGSTLNLHHPDGRDETLVDPGPTGAIADPFVTFDGKAVLYSRCPNVRDLRLDVQFTPASGCDIERIDLATKQITVLTHQEREASGDFPVYNTGPTPVVVQGKRLVAFTSNRRNFYPPKGYGQITNQLYVMNEDGSNPQAIMPMSIGGVLHPFQLTNGHLCFSSKESQGLRDNRVWAVWCSLPDGRGWYPVVSAFQGGGVFHFATQLSNTDLVYENYYNLNNYGFGSFNVVPLSRTSDGPSFGPANAFQNAAIAYADGCGAARTYQSSFTWKGTYALTPWTNPFDEASPVVNASNCGSASAETPRAGKVTHPSGAPGNALLMAYSPGSVNRLPRPSADAPHSGIYLAPSGVIAAPSALVKVVDDPGANELWPRAVVPYTAIYGVDAPSALPFLPNDGAVHPALPAGTASGLVGTSSVFAGHRESAPGDSPAVRNYLASGITMDGLEPFNIPGDNVNQNWETQGADTRVFGDNDIAAVRILAMEPNQGTVRGWKNKIDERLRILGDVPVHPDGSFLAKVPADLPFTFQLIDKDGLMLSMAQTWHQVRPGEMRADCGGCHAHSTQPLDFAQSIAATSSPVDLTLQPAHDVEFRRDINPILMAKCASCHTGTNAPGGLALTSDPAQNWKRLADGQNENLPAVGYPNAWSRLNASKFVRTLNSSRSLLTWVLYGRRMDGWTNDRWPGPPRAGLTPDIWARYMSDLDFVPGTVDHKRLVTDEERRLVVSWIDLAMPIDDGKGEYFKTANRLGSSTPSTSNPPRPPSRVRISP